MNARKTRRTDDDDVELETALQELVLDLLRDGIKTNVRGRAHFFNVCGGHDSCVRGEEDVGCAGDSSTATRTKDAKTGNGK